ncbi:glycosyltransferase family 4 protein [Marixanthomonas ophiurae]|uniref:Glycosyltransferase family 1 protein n=1 Tax=Marixanthomonas ophiurae TaxID=387659 RepID=A0A3E1Q6I5_9FLAO|nr:glycosyltransferase family 4 protein [Marixanthomonas ophiurae]RFN57747.1 glycosyltransferase family 1 protein [Marixanthomonas ophiurae]
MKVLFFTNEYSHPNLPASGGVGSFLKILAHELSKKGHTVYVYGFSKKKYSLKDGDISIEFFKKYSKSFPISEAIRSVSSKINIESGELHFLEKERKYLVHKLKKYALSHNIDIIESFAFNGFTAFWDNTIPLVVRFHGSRGFWHHYLNQEQDRFKILMEQKALETTPYTIAVSKFSAEAVKSIYNIDMDTIIHNGIDHNLFSPNPEVEEIPQSIFYFGTLSNAKGVDILCEIFNSLVETFPKATLHVIGQGESYWQNTCKSILTDKAIQASTYYGAKNNTELPEIIQQASLCIFPSKNESFGLVFAEAMALQKAIIVSNINAAKEIIDHKKNGYLANTIQDYIKFASTLLESSELRLEIGKEARKKVVENFTKETMTHETVSYYKKILNN